MTDDVYEECWRLLEHIAARTGHVLCECPECGHRQFCSYRPPSRPWPVCHTCRPEHLAGKGGLRPRLVVIGDLPAVRKNPGKVRTKRQLLEDGYRPRSSSS